VKLFKSNVTALIKSKLSSLLRWLPSRTQHALERAYHYRRNEPEIKLLDRLSNVDKISIDIGANRGLYTLFLTDLSRQVVCFEPNPDLSKSLDIKFKNKNVTVHNCALGSENTELTLRIPLVLHYELDGWGSLVAEFDGAHWKGNEVIDVKKVKVQCRVLDDFKYDNVGFIKIDVEGFEANVLKGSRQTILKNKPNLLIETENRHNAGGISEIFEFIEQMGYQGLYLHNQQIFDIAQFDASRLQREENADSGNDYIYNFIFIPKELDPSTLLGSNRL
jgi:FkbM family methyltransferase